MFKCAHNSSSNNFTHESTISVWALCSLASCLTTSVPLVLHLKEENNRQVFFYEVISFWWQSLVSVDKLDHVILTARKPLYHSSIHVVCIYWPKPFPHQDSEDHYVVGRFINNKGWNYKKKCNEQMYWINCYKLANKKCNIDFSNFDSFIDMFVYLQNGNIHAF